MANLSIRKIVPERDRIAALRQKVSQREQTMTNLLLGAYLKRCPDASIQIRYEVISERKYIIYIEPDEGSDLPELPGQVESALAAPDKKKIQNYAQQFAQQSPYRNPALVAIAVEQWPAMVSINFVPHQPAPTLPLSHLETRGQKNLKATGGRTALPG